MLILQQHPEVVLPNDADRDANPRVPIPRWTEVNDVDDHAIVLLPTNHAVRVPGIAASLAIKIRHLRILKSLPWMINSTSLIVARLDLAKSRMVMLSAPEVVILDPVDAAGILPRVVLLVEMAVVIVAVVAWEIRIMVIAMRRTMSTL